MQRFMNLFIFTDALNVSGGSSALSSGAHNCTYSFRYCQPILLLAATVEEMELNRGSISSTVAAGSSIGLTIPDTVCTVMCSWWWAEEPPETFRASVKINMFKKLCRSSISPTVAASSSIGWQYLKLYVQLCAPDDGRRNRLKHLERL